MDLSSLYTKENADSGAVLHLTHPTSGVLLYGDDENKKEPFTLTLVGADSDEFYKKSNELKANKSMKDATPKDRNCKLYASLTKSCSLVLNGEKVKMNQIEKIYSDYPWILEQAVAFTVDRSNYMNS